MTFMPIFGIKIEVWPITNYQLRITAGMMLIFPALPRFPWRWTWPEGGFWVKRFWAASDGRLLSVATRVSGDSSCFWASCSLFFQSRSTISASPVAGS